MKTKSIVVILLFMICSSAFADLTDQDLEKIQQMLDKHDKALREYIDLNNKALRDYIDLRIAQAESKIAQVDTKVEEIKGSITLLTWALGFVALFIIAVLAAPQWVTIKREAEDRKWGERMDRLEKEIAELRKAEGGGRRAE